MKVTVVGTGYVGLVTGACLADMGNHVLCLDLDARKIAILNSGGIPIHEPGLDAIVARNVQSGRLRFTTDVALAVNHGVIQFIGVGTPPDEDGSADMRYVLAAATNIAQHMQEYRVIVNKSTVPVGTADQVGDTVNSVLRKRGVDIPFAVVSNPEFLKEGAAVDDCMKPERIIIGCNDEHALTLMRELYQPFMRNHDKLQVMDVRSAELTKYAANAMLATRISFMNELARLADAVGADIEHVRRGIGSDSRIGTHFLYPGTGYGGSCFPKDVKALQQSAQQQGIELRVLAAVESVNERQKRILVEKLTSRLGEDLTGRTIALWGLAFKPNTDDMREAPSLVIIDALHKLGARVRAYDPVAMSEAARLLDGMDWVELVPSADAAVQGADALLIATEWKEFRNPDFDALKAALKQPLIVDGRNLYDPVTVRRWGIEYLCIGRQSRC